MALRFAFHSMKRNAPEESAKIAFLILKESVFWKNRWESSGRPAGSAHSLSRSRDRLGPAVIPFCAYKFWISSNSQARA